MRRLAVFFLAAWLAACSVPGPPPQASRSIPGDCNPAPDASRAQYIIGYGSLMQDESRKRTSPQAGPAHPVEVQGYRRGWFSRPETVGFSTTFLGVRPDRESHFNAVIYQVDAAELLATDKRELSYCRADLAVLDVKPLEKDLALEGKGQIWIYVSKPESIATPSARYPIVQSYVDIFVSGCLEQEQRFGLADFSEQCLATTSDWSEHWVNDRLYPRRPFIYQPKARQIDNLLARHLQPYFSRITLGP